METSLTERRGSKAVRLPDSCSRATAGGRVFSMLTIAIFTGSPGVMSVSYSSVRINRNTKRKHQISIEPLNVAANTLLATND